MNIHLPPGGGKARMGVESKITASRFESTSTSIFPLKGGGSVECPQGSFLSSTSVTGSA